MKVLNILSLGAGVQSTTVLLMSCIGQLPKMDAAIFADVGWEPKEVYRHLAWLTEFAAMHGIKIIQVKHGDLRADALVSQVRGRSTQGRRWASMPMYTKDKAGNIGMIRRQCTGEYKIFPIQKKIRELIGLKPKQRGPKEIAVRQYFGISWDEIGRMRDPEKKWIENVYPLIDMRMTRQSCLDWLEKNGFPLAPRSACIGCPFHSDAEWQKIKDDPEQWLDAVEFDEQIGNCGGMRGQMFLHRSCKPLKEIDFRSRDVRGGQPQLTFENSECTGMCGV